MAHHDVGWCKTVRLADVECLYLSVCAYVFILGMYVSATTVHGLVSLVVSYACVGARGERASGLVVVVVVARVWLLSLLMLRVCGCLCVGVIGRWCASSCK